MWSAISVSFKSNAGMLLKTKQLWVIQAWAISNDNLMVRYPQVAGGCT